MKRITSQLIIATLGLFAAGNSIAIEVPLVAKQCHVSIGGGNAFIQVESGTGCPGCQAFEVEKAIDNDPSTFSTVLMGAAITQGEASGSISLTSSAQAGVVFPAGSRPGVWIAKSSAETGLGSFEVSTLLEGHTQDSSLTEVQNGVGANVVSTVGYVGLNATLPFDAVRVTQKTSAGSFVIRLYEVCAD